ncbi:POK18 protein, partial [Crotophaga sulcirostris]|nr:POK18 protein [Crotophaga sulcirostris]
LELRAVIEVFNRFSHCPVNIVCDSLYVVGVVSRIERSLLKEVQDMQLMSLFKQLWLLVEERTHCYFITHIRSHLTDQGELAEGNRHADLLVSPAWAPPPLDKFGQAVRSHNFLHQSAQVLQRKFSLSESEARGIVKSCADCQRTVGGLGSGVNP